MVTLGVTVVVFVPGRLPGHAVPGDPRTRAGAPCAARSREVQLQLLVVVTIGTVLTTWGYGPLAEAPDRYALPDDVTGIVLQSFFIACVLVTIPLSMAVGQQVENARQARVERDRVQQIVNSANVAIIGADEIGRVTLVQPGRRAAAGLPAGRGARPVHDHVPHARGDLATGRASSASATTSSTVVAQAGRARTRARSTSSSCARTASSAPTR